jgi:hypothetical protein
MAQFNITIIEELLQIAANSSPDYSNIVLIGLPDKNDSRFFIAISIKRFLLSLGAMQYVEL